ncbi:uncharacterized protein LOC132062945 [Lycium ferocissimum]|uniref:uncharacterized protein LOC132062945 n=1 Tax=Lycium ferocissimum TaxID=112874 RepID=UPI0028165F98|nr:uncharacterized protein LOC132062945 [Lycium ferocissimum]
MDAKRQKYLWSVNRTKQIMIKDETQWGGWLLKSNSFTLMVDPKDTIGAVKAYIQEEKGISFKKQKLLLGGGDVVCDEQTLDSLGIKKDSTLILRYAPITVMEEISGVKMLMLSFIVKDPWSLSRTMEIVIHDDIYKDVIKFRSVSKSKLSKFGLEEDTIKDCRNSYTLMVDPYDTVAAVKAYIQEQTGFSFNKQKLLLNNDQGGRCAVLRNDQTLVSLGIRKGSSLILRFGLVYKISFTHTRTGCIFNIRVKPGDTVADVKASAQKKTGEPLPISCRGQILPDDHPMFGLEM